MTTIYKDLCPCGAYILGDGARGEENKKNKVICIAYEMAISDIFKKSEKGIGSCWRQVS